MITACDDLRMMPPQAPLLMATQSFRAPARHRRPALAQPQGAMQRLGAFGPAIVLALSLALWLTARIVQGSVTLAEGIVLLLIGTNLVWLSLSVSAAILALVNLPGRPLRTRSRGGRATSVALLVPVHHEEAADVLGNIDAMRAELARGRRRHRYAFFILSDTRDPDFAAREMRGVAHLRAQGGIAVHYRRRLRNTDRKIGNIHDWITRWGADWDAMIILDADSLMSGPAIRHLADAMADDPDAGLIQSLPVLVSSETLFGRMQEFAASVYGWLSAQGLALWSRSEGNYWGHNAIIRTRAFAESARLPHLRGRSGASHLILSHDFVEAAMLRRAGWSVRFLARPGGSYEETPATLMDYLLRDRRWCRGNMQHLRLLFARGFHPVSRYHMAHGAVAYLLSPAWLAFLVIWVALLPGQGPPIHAGWVLGAIVAMLLFPRIVAAVLMLRGRGMARLYGGAGFFLATVVTEIVLAVLYAPILMVQQSKAVLRAIIGWPEAWLPQRRGPVNHGWPVLVRFHWLEVAMGAGLVLGMVAGVISIWLSLVAFSLITAPVLSWVSGLRVSGRRCGPLRLDTPCSLRAPRVVQAALDARARLRVQLDTARAPPPAIAAE